MKEQTHKLINENQSVRTSKYYHRQLVKLCGPNYTENLRPQKRDYTKEVLRNHKHTLLVTGPQFEINCFRTEALNIIVHNNMSCVRTNDTELVKLNFHELGELPDTTIENFIELVAPDLLWLDICTTKNSFIPHQIMLIVSKREEAGKRTILYSPDTNKNVWQALYESTSFITFLTGYLSGSHVSIKGFK